MNEIVKLMVDAYSGNTGTNFSKEEAQEGLRAALIEIMGTDKIDYKAMRKNGAEVFALVEEALDVLIPATVEEQFNVFAEVKSYQFGDKPVFSESDTALFKVAVISEGNNNLRRQRLWSGSTSFTVDTQWKGVKIYDEMYRFLTGRIDWPATVNRIAASYAEHIRLDVYNTFVGTYPTLAATYKLAGNPTVDTLSDLIQHVESASGRTATIVGTKNALGKVPQSHLTQKAMDTFNGLGHFGTFQGTDMVMLRQGYKINTTTWSLDDKKLLILPTGDVKPVKILLEGYAIIKETGDPMDTADMTMEYTFLKKAGIAVIQSVQYGIVDMP